MIQTPQLEGEPETLLDVGEMRVRNERWTCPGGSSWSHNTVARVPVVAVLPIRMNSDTGLPEALLIGQYRLSIQERTEEAVAGGIDLRDAVPGASELHVAMWAAHRELAEETGLATQNLIPLGCQYVSPGWTDEKVWLFLADGVTHVDAERPAWETGNIEPRWYPLHVLCGSVDQGSIHDLKTSVLIVRADRWIRKQAEIKIAEEYYEALCVLGEEGRAEVRRRLDDAELMASPEVQAGLEALRRGEVEEA